MDFPTFPEWSAVSWSLDTPGYLPGAHGEGANLECVPGAAGKNPGLGACGSNPRFSAFQDLGIGAAAVMPIPALGIRDLLLLWEFLMAK